MAFGRNNLCFQNKKWKWGVQSIKLQRKGAGGWLVPGEYIPVNYALPNQSGWNSRFREQKYLDINSPLGELVWLSRINPNVTYQTVQEEHGCYYIPTSPRQQAHRQGQFLQHTGNLDQIKYITDEGTTNTLMSD